MATLFRYVALGDSTAVGTGAATGGGYPERIWQRIKGSGVHAGLLNLGVNGATAADVLQYQLARRIPSADLVTLGIGSNDLWRLASPSAFEASVTTIAEKLVEIGAPVLVFNLVDLSRTPVASTYLPALGVPAGVVSQRVSAFNHVLARVVQGRPRFTLMDLHALGEEQLRKHEGFFAADGFHPSSEGYARWAEFAWPAVEQLLRAWKQVTPEKE